MVRVIVLLLLVCLAAPAFAEPALCPYDVHLSIMYNYLTEPQRKLYDAMYDALRSGKSSVQVPVGMEMSDAKWMTDYIYNEAPELCAYDRWATTVSRNSDGSLTVRLAYKFPISVQDGFIRTAQELAASFANKKEKTALRSIHDYLIKRFSYGSVDGEDTQLAYFALKNNTAVCNGYAQTTAMLCHFAGYSCSYIDGHIRNDDGTAGGGHAWNVAYVDTKFFWFDTTWDDLGRKAGTQWFGLDGKTMGKTHIPDPEYSPIANRVSFLPDTMTYTMHLDLNGKNGFIRGISSRDNPSVSLKTARSGEYFSPAMVLYENGKTVTPVTVSCRMNGSWKSWGSCSVQPKSNLAFRANTAAQEGRRGRFEITWYVNGNRLGVFHWTVK